MEPALLVLLGPPHSGKSSMAKLLAHRECFHNIDLGDLLRQIVTMQPDHPHYAEIHHAVSTGTLISDDTALEIVKDSFPTANPKHIVLNGFPRTTTSVTQFKLFLKRIHTPSTRVVLAEFSIDVPSLTLDRGRSDDLTPVVLRNRISTFNSKTKPVIAELAKTHHHTLLPFSNGIERNYAILTRFLHDRVFAS